MSEFREYTVTTVEIESQFLVFKKMVLKQLNESRWTPTPN